MISTSRIARLLCTIAWSGAIQKGEIRRKEFDL